MNSKKTLFLIEVAIFAALALVLDIIPLSFKIWAQGGSISFAMIPIFIVAFRWGIKGGLLAGLIWGALQIPFGAWIMHPVQGFLDYIVAFTVLGFAGVFAKQIKEALKEGQTKTYLTYITFGIIIGSMLRFAAHFVAGVVFFAEYMPPEFTNIWVYSLIYNISYIVPSIILCTVVVFFLFNKQPKALLSTAA
ncbi:energy-coupled thiamine transporter ThiT [Ornithinibacillus sp. L9]|uniref:Energy-coupled thiamine transporter ThiT n=1 Tax=Ornithinibacillus caprae TaxID=2678566 RepID=A0A6N8FLN1_9BACI|nr:energy-coupled thiamine transporter ThiT [Ornithinibacillus caprae]MUK90273.1 energy-coupled thiamine transporter ThiT [Ornithinibacillus caprae]